MTYARSNPNAPDHSALVDHIDPDGTVWLRSKDQDNSEFIHRLGKEGDKNYFRDAFALAQDRPLRYFRPLPDPSKSPGVIQIYEKQHQDLRDAMHD